MTTNKTYEERIEERDKLFNEVQFLENEKAKIEAKLATKRKSLKEICMCNEREGMFEYSVCKHCGEHH